MKRLTLLFILVFALGFMSDANAQRAIKNGSSLNLIIGFPSESFGAEEAIESDYAFSTIWGLQYGNRWYIAPTEKFGVAVMLNWIDFTMGYKSGADSYSDWARLVIDFSFLEVGPVATYAINGDMAIDGYYNLRPTVLGSGQLQTIPASDDVQLVYSGFGFSHAIGAAFRWKVLNVGLEYVTGGINSEAKYTGPGNPSFDDMKNKTNSVRLLLGVKF